MVIFIKCHYLHDSNYLQFHLSILYSILYSYLICQTIEEMSHLRINVYKMVELQVRYVLPGVQGTVKGRRPGDEVTSLVGGCDHLTSSRLLFL